VTDRDPLDCGDFRARVRWAGTIYNTVLYEVRRQVTSVADATTTLAAIKSAIAAQYPAWRVGEERLIPTESGRYVLLCVDVAFDDG
jgi:hypothetical protein